jgi:hypothetical protein
MNAMTMRDITRLSMMQKIEHTTNDSFDECTMRILTTSEFAESSIFVVDDYFKQTGK